MKPSSGNRGLGSVGTGEAAVDTPTAPDAQIDEETRQSENPTFTYLGFADTAPGSLPAPRLSGTIMVLAGVGFALLGFKGMAAMGPIAWLPVSIGGVLALAGLAIATQAPTGKATSERLIRVHFGARAIEFISCSFSTGLVRRTLIDSYLCPVEELVAFEYFSNPRSYLASLRIWTARGYLQVSGEPLKLRLLARSFEAVAGTKRPPVAQRTWVVMLVVILVAFLVCAAAVYFKIV
jgi:hypothetical protein